jgi:hypothetical protein
VPFRNPKKYSTITTTSLPSPSPTSLEHVCPSNQRFYSCIGCQHTCDNKKIPSTCILECIRGCGCKEGYVRNPDNECILPNECPIVYPVQSIEEESIESLIEDTSLDPANSKSLPIENEAGSLSPDDSTSAKSFIETELDESQETSLEEYSSQYTTSTWTFNYNDFLKSQEEELGFTEVVESQYVAVPVQDGCGRNEEPSVCVGCERTCKMGSHTHSCPSICSLGCACKDGFARDELNQCIPSSECPPPEKEYVDENALPFTTLDMDSIITIAPFIECPVNQIYKQCVDCDPLCEEGGVPRDKTCLDHCRPGCGCLPGMVKSRDQCMLLSECPFTDLKQPELRIAEIDEENGKNGTDICPVNQKMKTCIECEGTCDFPAGSTDCIGSCSSGCGCKQGFLKDGNGNCIPPSQCPLLKKRAGAEPPCPSNQIYRECKVCDEYCDGMIRPCPKMCVPGCNCAPGMVRDGVHCVKRDTCPV